MQKSKQFEVFDVNIDDIKCYENNPRKNDPAIDKVAAAIQEFGFQQPLVINKDNVIVVGHTRYKAAKQLGLKTVPCKYMNEESEEQANAYRLADNKTAELAGWDFDLLAEELKGIEEIDMEQFGFKPDEDLDSIINDYFEDTEKKETEKKHTCPQCGFEF